MSSEQIPIIVISPEAKAALSAEVERTGYLGELTGGLLFGCPCNEEQRLIISSVRLSSAVGFGQRDFSLDQTRTSRQLDDAQSLDPKASYCGVWYLHRTPIPELSAEEWVQTQTVLEDPDFSFKDLACLVLCYYSGKLQMYAFAFNHYHSTRGQPPAPTELRLTTDTIAAPTASTQPPPTQPHDDWYKSHQVAARLSQEHHNLAEKYKTETARTQTGQVFFRLSPRHEHEQLEFCLAVGPGFPEKAPHVFLLLSGRLKRISVPSLGGWTESSRLVKVADELVEWLSFSVNEYMAAAEEAIGRGKFTEAADLASIVLAINPRTPGAPRLLAKAQAQL